MKGQDWDELEALRESLREHMDEIKRLNDCLTWEQHRAEHVGTHGPGCAEWGPKHYECLLRAHRSLKERTDRSAEIHRLRAAGRQALEALENPWSAGPSGVADVITVLRAALTEDRSADTGKTSDHIPDAGKMVEPVAYISGYKQGYCVIEPVDRNVLLPVGMALYRSPPKREPLTDAEIKRLYDSLPSKYTLAMFARAVERAHGIGGEE